MMSNLIADVERSRFRHCDSIPSASCAMFFVATRSPAFKPLVISTRSPTISPVVTIRSSTWSPRRRTRGWCPRRLHARRRNQHARRAVPAARSARSRTVPASARLSAFGTIASTVSARWSACSAGETYLHLALELPAGIGVDLEGDRLARRHRRHGLLGHRQLHAQRVRPARRSRLSCPWSRNRRGDEPLARRRRRTARGRRVGQRLVRERDARARGLQRSDTAARRRSSPPRTAAAPLPSACGAGRIPTATRRADRAAT